MAQTHPRRIQLATVPSTLPADGTSRQWPSVCHILTAYTRILQLVHQFHDQHLSRAFSTSCGSGCQRSRLHCADLLTLQHYTGPKEDWNVNINCTDKWGQTPLHVAALAGHADVVELLLNKKNKENCDIDAEDEDGNKAIDVARDAATLAQLNAVIHGRPSVRTLQMQEEARQAELDELSEELAEYQYVGEEGEILGGDEDDAELMHALAVLDAPFILSYETN